MFDESKFVMIDIFKGTPIYKNLEQYNKIVEDVATSGDYSAAGYYDTNKNQLSFWFDPKQVRYTPLPSCYPDIHPVQHDKRLSLVTHCANHVILLLMETLYNDRKDILVEDICCGMGNLIFYLSKLGFKKFNAIDNFSQLPKPIFEKLMNVGSINYTLNDMNADAVVSSLVAYTSYVKRDKKDKPIFSKSLELFLSYVPILPGANHLHFNNSKFLEEFNFVPLCEDPYRMIWGYCREDKYDLFRSKLQVIQL